MHWWGKSVATRLKFAWSKTETFNSGTQIPSIHLLMMMNTTYAKYFMFDSTVFKWYYNAKFPRSYFKLVTWILTYKKTAAIHAQPTIIYKKPSACFWSAFFSYILLEPWKSLQTVWQIAEHAYDALYNYFHPLTPSCSSRWRHIYLDREIKQL